MNSFNSIVEYYSQQGYEGVQLDRKAAEVCREIEKIEKPRFPNAMGMKVAAEICAALKPFCKQLVVAGSLRRRKPTIRDVEILYVGEFETRKHPEDMFSSVTINLADEAIAALEKSGALERRKNVNGSEMYGKKNKLMRHVQSGIGVDFFSTTTECWFNYLVCRTGPAESNTRIAMAAQKMGWTWHPYGTGFSRGGAAMAGPYQEHLVSSEEDVFRFVGLPYREPNAR